MRANRERSSRESPGGPAADRRGSFDRHRTLHFSIAYRMLGSVMDTEDVLQEAYLRWQRASGKEIQSPKAYLCATVTRLCIDYLRSAGTRLPASTRSCTASSSRSSTACAATKRCTSSWNR
jgi:DNA-directed RNA polymerase specialized sigma24 family protein